jgi:hypothetical protein
MEDEGDRLLRLDRLNGLRAGRQVARKHHPEVGELVQNAAISAVVRLLSRMRDDVARSASTCRRRAAWR